LQLWSLIPFLHIFAKMESMIRRAIFEEAKFALTQFRSICITGPRQSGKTTLSKQLFHGKPYVNFEDPTIQYAFESDVVGFMQKYHEGAIFDEVQRTPTLFRHLQVLLDNNTSRGQFILTGSNNFLLQEQISQSLAGRVGYLTLLPFSFEELKQSEMSGDDIMKLIMSGGYPEIWTEKLQPHKWLKSYIQTYIQRDVRQIRNIANLGVFNRFVSLCANYAGQILNRDVLAKSTGVDTKTIQAWLALLENSYILFQLQPWTNNLNKRIIKSPKIYFYDTGLLCSLLNIQSKESLKKHNHYGAIFENWCITEIRKNMFNRGEADGMFYFRDSTGNEIDLILEKETGPLAIEIKSSGTAKPDQLNGLKFWNKYQRGSQGLLLHQGNTINEINEFTSAMSWKEIDTL
jgi:predicted AAA+ superfamily ATPase